MKELLLLPAAPLRFTIWVAEQVSEQAEREYFSEAAGVRQLEEIEQSRERGELDEGEAEALEEKVLERQLSRAGAEEEAKGG
jgi:hypothetical protein